MAAVCTELQAELMRAHFHSRAERFLELSGLVDQLAEVLFIDPMEGYIGRILFALATVGVIPIAAANAPWGPGLPANDFENITNGLNALIVQVGYCFHSSVDIQKSTPAIARRSCAITNVFAPVCLKTSKTMFASNIESIYQLPTAITRSRTLSAKRQVNSR
jgi:hypothetical protein